MEAGADGLADPADLRLLGEVAHAAGHLDVWLSQPRTGAIQRGVQEPVQRDANRCARRRDRVAGLEA